MKPRADETSRGGVARQHDVLATAASAAPRHGRGAPPARRPHRAGAAALTPRRPHRLAVDRDRRRRSRASTLAGERVEEFALAVAGDAGDRDDLAAADLERDVLERDGEWMSSAARRELLEPQANRRRPSSGRGVRTARDFAADHHAGEARRRLLRGSQVRDHLAVAQDGGAVAEPLHLLEAMQM